MSRPTRTERRRAQLALRIASLEQLESRNLATESLGILTAGIGVPTASIAATAHRDGSAQVLAKTPRVAAPDATTVPVVIPIAAAGSGGRGSFRATPVASTTLEVALGRPTVSLPTLVPKANGITLTSAAPTNPPKGGGAGGSSHGGSGAVAPPVTAGPAAGATTTTATNSAGSSSSVGSTSSAPILPVSTS